MHQQAIIYAALKEERWKLEPALKIARLYDPSVSMEDINKWRVENFNLEKRPRKFNSWVANRRFDEYQSDLLSFDDVGRRGCASRGYN